MNSDPIDVGKPPEKKISQGRPRSPSVDEAILRATLELFVERGLSGTGIEQVAEKSGVARTTIYRRWPSKESLIAAALARGRGLADEKVLHTSPSARTTIKSVIAALAGIVSSANYAKMVARLIGSIPDQPELMAIYFKTFLAPRRKVAAEALELARTQGLVRKDVDSEIALDLVAGAILYRLLIHRDKSSEKDINKYLHKVLRELRLEAVK